MNLTQFLTSLLHEGRVRVDPVFTAKGDLIDASPELLEQAADVLEIFESESRSELSHVPPILNRRVLQWGAQNIYRACSLLIYRDAPAESLPAALSGPCPESAPTPSVVYSVDQTYRFLPDLVRMARAAAADDPLVKILVGWGSTWPLSSVGVQGITTLGPLDWLSDPCLRQLYVDRILLSQDESRIEDARVRAAVMESLGRHLDLAPKLAVRLSGRSVDGTRNPPDQDVGSKPLVSK